MQYVAVPVNFLGTTYGCHCAVARGRLRRIALVCVGEGWPMPPPPEDQRDDNRLLGEGEDDLFTPTTGDESLSLRETKCVGDGILG